MYKRKLLVTAMLCACAVAPQAQPQPQPALQAPLRRTLLVVGDSISAEHEIRPGTGWVALLRRKLADEKMPVDVTNASAGGRTLQQGLARLPDLLAQTRPAWVVIQLGTNDVLFSTPLAAAQETLTRMVQLSRKAGAQVLLVGVHVPASYGERYLRRFGVMYAKVARDTHSALVPALVRPQPGPPLRWFQDDGYHPTQAAQPVMLANVWPALSKLLK